MIANAEAGGDNAGRAAMIGAWLGAMHGPDGIPEAWRRRLTSHDPVAGWIETMLSSRAP